MFDKKNYKNIFVIFIIFFCVLVTFGNFYNLGIFSKQKINLGLDLKGGSHLLLQVDFDYYKKEQLNNDLDIIKDNFLRDRIKALSKIDSDSIVIFYKNADDYVKIKKIINNVNDNLTIKNSKDNNRTIIVEYKEEYINNLQKKVNKETVEIIRKRIDEFGTRDVVIQVEGNDRILVQVAGLSNSSELKELLGKTAKLTFHIADDDERNDIVSLKDINDRYEMNVQKRAMMSGDSLIDASVSYDKGKPVIMFKLNNSGAKRFADITGENIGKILVIVLDDKIITAPRINGRIDGGSGIITGEFSADEATKTVILLKSGSLIAPLSIIEEKTVGASLGYDLIEQGIKSCIYGLILIIAFIFIFYKHFGIFSNITVLLNICFLITLLSIFGVTLTLPGIAGIILTIGMSTDATILIFERIKEEYSKNTNIDALQIIKNGFDNTMSTILDSNLTTILVAIVLYIFGTGAVKGFAVILILGIISSMFASIVCLRIMLDWYYKNKKLINING